jgi:hypothetical protein
MLTIPLNLKSETNAKSEIFAGPDARIIFVMYCQLEKEKKEKA